MDYILLALFLGLLSSPLMLELSWQDILYSFLALSALYIFYVTVTPVVVSLS